MIASPGLPPPHAARRPHVLVAHGDRRVDDWWWLRDRDAPEVLAYLDAENAYADATLAPHEALVEQLFNEIKGRVQEDDVSAPSRNGAWWYWTRTTEGEQYASYCRLADPEHRLSAPEALEAAVKAQGDVVLDENALAAGHDFFSLGVFDLSNDHRLLAYAVDTDGSELYTMRIRDLARGEDLDDVIEGVYYGSAWGGEGDGATLFYVRPDDAMRPYQVWRHQVGTPASDDVLVFEDPDERFFVAVGLTRSERFVIIHSESKMTSESHWLPAATPGVTPSVVMARRQGIEYDVDHAVLPEGGDVWLVRSNEAGEDGEPATNFALRALPLDGAAGWVVVPHRPEVKLEAVDAFARHLVLIERTDGLERMAVIDLASGARHVVGQPDPVYSLAGGVNPEWDATTYRFGYTSLVTPVSTVDYDPVTQRREVIKVQPVLGGYRSADYRSERIWAAAPDGTRVPISLVCRADQALDGTAPTLLYGYGSYEITIDPTFSASRVNLLERGVIFAIAHIRGGGEMGRRWYEEGRLALKPNTFSDFVAAAQHLIAEGYADPTRLSIRGGSAGGLLMGAVTNMHPELFAAVVADVPFVDVVSTMSDESLPLTVTEWEEWGNPVADADAYATMLSYSPYDNVVAGADYPAMYVTAGLNDPRVGYWEPAKWVAKLRAETTGRRPILLRTEMGAGHQGPSGRYDAWRDEARTQAFLLLALDLA